MAGHAEENNTASRQGGGVRRKERDFTLKKKERDFTLKKMRKKSN